MSKTTIGKSRILLLSGEGFIFFTEAEFQKQVEALKIILGEPVSVMEELLE